MCSTARMRLPFLPQHSLGLYFHPNFLEFCIFASPSSVHRVRSSACPLNDLGVHHSQSSPLQARAEKTTTDTSPRSASRVTADLQQYPEQLLAERACNHFSGALTCASRPRPPDDAISEGLQHTPLTTPSNAPDLVEPQMLLAPQQRPLNCEPPEQSSSYNLLNPRQKNLGMFNRAHNCVVTGTFIDGNVSYNNVSSKEFMEKLLKETILGAASDSSARDPPPRCHPGTRLAILERCLSFIRNCDNAQKMRWVFGAAGVGKSAIMQSVAESPDLQVDYHASVFFSIKGRNDGTKAIMTISYQCAAKCEPYRQVVEREITRDPSLLRSSMANQFKRLIVEPFIYDAQLKSVRRVLIIIDGLDECNEPRTQQELLRLISDFCATYPSSPLVWLIASRPEPHITSFFSRPEVVPVYEKEEIQVDADEARADVERYLRYELHEIKRRSDSLDPQWPEERDIWKVASAAGGLFAYATTVVRYIGDWRIGNPVSLLSDVLHVIDKHSMIDLSGDEHPMALLDALYERILSNVPSKIMINTRKLLLVLASDWAYALNGAGNFVVLCNWLGMTPEEAYGALHHLRSVLDVPRRDNACWDNLEPFHKSFIDYVSDFTRSGFSPDIRCEARQLAARCAFRILKEAPDGVTVPQDNVFQYGVLARASPTGDDISLTWSVEKGSGWSDIRTRLNVYQLAIGGVIGQIKHADSTFESGVSVHALTARFAEYSSEFPLAEFCDWVFAEPRRSNFILSGVLKQAPLGAVNLSAIVENGPVKLRFRSPATMVANSVYPWGLSCQHKRIGEWGKGKNQDLMTTHIPTDCNGCYDRLKHWLRSWKRQSPDLTVLILFTSTDKHCVEVHFVDPADGVSEWTYWFWFKPKRYTVFDDV